MMTIRFLLVAFATLLVIGCAQKPQPEPSFSYQQQLPFVTKLSDWDITARVSIQTQADAVTATLKWRKLGNYQRLELTGTLGQTYTTLELNDEQSTLFIKDREPITSTNIEALMFQELGFIFPIELLTNWVRALPMDVNDPRINVDDQGLIRSMRHNDWQVSYRKYRRYPKMEELQLPSRLTLSNNTETVKLAIKTWQML
jgi:outer membrane lipoprotein LolB